MDMKDFLNELRNQYSVGIQDNNDQIIIKNKTNEKYLAIECDACEIIGSGKEYIEYIVIFQTQHCHFEEQEDVFDYVKDILNDQVIPIEFFDAAGKDRFGGEIRIEDLPLLSVSLLSKRLYVVPEDIAKLFFECHSWSGKYDLPRQPVSVLPKELTIEL